MIVIDRDQRAPIQAESEEILCYSFHRQSHGAPVYIGVAPGPPHVGSISAAFGPLEIQHSQTRSNWLGFGHVMRPDRLAHRARAAVNHQPEAAAVLVGLELDEVIAATKCAELQLAF